MYIINSNTLVFTFNLFSCHLRLANRQRMLFSLCVYTDLVSERECCGIELLLSNPPLRGDSYREGRTGQGLSLELRELKKVCYVCNFFALPTGTSFISASSRSGSLAPGLVNPGHIIWAPLNTNLIAPLSTWTWHRGRYLSHSTDN